MQKELVTDKEAICLFITFIIGSSLIIGVGEDAKNDACIAVTVGVIMAIPMLIIYSRILAIYQGKDIFDILNCTLGTVMGTIVSIIYILYAFHLGALVLRNFGEFINTVALPETPMFVPILCMGIVCIISARLGIEVMGRKTTYFLPVLLLVLLIVQLLAIPQLKLDYMKPILGNGLQPVLKGGFSTSLFHLQKLYYSLACSLH
jgi:spore germination protein KB